MDFKSILLLLETYGYIIIFVIVFLEYLGIPGFPSNLIMPAAGLFIVTTGMNFIPVLIISVAAAICASYLVYVLGYRFGFKIIAWGSKRYKKLGTMTQKINGYVEKHGNKSVMIARVIPVARTLISLVAGTFQVPPVTFGVYSVMGIITWNALLIVSGMTLGRFIL